MCFAEAPAQLLALPFSKGCLVTAHQLKKMPHINYSNLKLVYFIRLIYGDALNVWLISRFIHLHISIRIYFPVGKFFVLGLS